MLQSWNKSTNPLTGLNQYYRSINDKTHVIHESIVDGKIKFNLLDKQYNNLDEAISSVQMKDKHLKIREIVCVQNGNCDCTNTCQNISLV